MLIYRSCLSRCGVTANPRRRKQYRMHIIFSTGRDVIIIEFGFDLVFENYLSRCGVTANIPVLGTGDSGFESRHLDKKNLPAEDFLR